MWLNGICLFAFAIAAAQGAPHYAVVIPDTIRPDRDYSVALSVWDVTGPVEVTVTVSGYSRTRGFHSSAKSEMLDGDNSRLIKLETGDWGPGEYNLTVVGRGSLSFINETKLQYHHQSYAVLIQTDRAIYKPGSPVYFRAVVINPFLQPVPSITAVITIKDGNGNLIEQWQHTTPANGVLTGDFLLSNEPVLGDWAVHVDIQGQQFNKTFVVAEYILPTYHVQIDLPTYVTYSKSDVTATIKAMYHYGKPVKGEITLTVAPLVRYNYLSVRPLEVYQVKSSIDGVTKVPVNLMRDLKLKTDFFKREIEFFVLVEEEGTGRKYNSTNTMWIYDKDIALELVKTAEFFKPGLKYTAFIRAAYQDNRPASGPLVLRYGYGGQEETWNTSQHMVPPSGVIRLDFYPPHERALRPLTLKAEFKGQSYPLGKIESATSPSNSFLQLGLLTERPRVDQNVRVEANATEPISQLIYDVMSHGDIIFSERIQNPSGQRTLQFSFRITPQMPPNVRVVAYYVRPENGEIVADTLNTNVEGTFRTPISITTNVKEGQPGQRMVVRVDTRPYSLVGILATDVKTTSIKTGNDITEQEVLKELRKFDGGEQTSKHWPPKHEHRTKREVWSPGSAAAAQMFTDSGVIILTDGLLPKAPPSKFGDDAIYLDEEVLIDPLQPPLDLPEGPEIRHKIILRQDLPPTWLWVNTTTGDDGAAVFSTTLPESLSSWKVSAFSVSPSTGLGIATAPIEVTVYRPFYVTLSLPRSVFRGESVSIQTVVFNNNPKPVQAEVSIDNRKGEFEFTSALDENMIEGKALQRKARIVTVPAKESVPVSFLITPLHYGSLEITVTATSSLQADTVTKKLLVRHEGTPQYFNKAVLVDLRGSQSVKATVKPSSMASRVTLSGVGDILGLVVSNRKELLRLPQGGGEHTLLNLVSTLVALRYLARSNQITESIRAACVADLKADYQRQLLFRRDDGSFSMFGNKDRDGSTWLTAYAVKTLLAVKSYITVDDNVTQSAISWLRSRHLPDGSFEEPGEVHHKVLQGESDSGNVALTAFVVSALAHANVHRQFSRELLVSEQFLIQAMFQSSDPYIVAIVNYALHLLDSTAREGAFQKLVGLAKVADDMMYWSQPRDPPINRTDKQSDYFFLPDSRAIETTGYALLTSARRGELSTLVPIIRWMVSCQNERGGFVSTQDTAVGIEALSSAAGLLGRIPSTFTLRYKVDEEGEQSLRVGPENALAATRVNLPSNVARVEVEAQGQGMGVMQVSWEYNLAVSGESPPFYLNALLDKTSTESYLQLSICTHSFQTNLTSNLAVMEVELPSGYLADVDALPSILQIPKVKRVVPYRGDTVVGIYFDKLDSEESCVTVPAHRTHKVAQQKRVPVKVYDYYNLLTSARMFYLPHQSSLCDICEGDDCGPKCKEILAKQKLKGGEEVAGSRAIPATTTCSLLLLVSTCLSGLFSFG